MGAFLLQLRKRKGVKNMTLTPYNLQLSYMPAAVHAIFEQMPSFAGKYTDKSSSWKVTTDATARTTTVNSGYAKLDGFLFGLDESLVLNWPVSANNPSVYLVIDFTQQNSFTGSVQTNDYVMVNNQASIVVSDTLPQPSVNSYVAKLGYYNNIDMGGYGLNVSALNASSATIQGTLQANLLKSNGGVEAGIYLQAPELRGNMPIVANNLGTAQDGIQYRYEKSGNTVMIKWAGTRTNGLSFGTVVKSWPASNFSDAYIEPYSNENWGTGEMSATFGGLRLQKTDTSYQLVWRGGSVGANAWFDGSITYITNESKYNH